MDELPLPEDLVGRYVGPFYLKMMGTNAPDAGRLLVSRIRRLSRELDVASIERLLLSQWRPRVMGTWYAVARKDLDLRCQLLDALRTSRGVLTSPALLAAAALEPGRDTMEAIAVYEAADRQHGYGGAELAHAAAEAVGKQCNLNSGMRAATAPNLLLLESLQRVCRQLAT